MADLHPAGTVFDSAPSSEIEFEWASLTKPAWSLVSITGTRPSAITAEYLSQFPSLAGVVESHPSGAALGAH